MINKMNNYYIIHSKPSCTIISGVFMQNRIDAQFYSSKYLVKGKVEFDNGLDYIRLGELGSNFSYGTPPYGHICDEGVPYLRIPDIEDDFFLSNSNLAFIDKEYHMKNIKNEVKAGDILFRIKGQLGQALVVPQKLSNSHTGSSFLRFTPKSINPYFLVCYLNSSFGRNQINRKQSNSIIQYLNMDDITSIRVPIPSPEIQEYIGDKVRKAEELREEAKRLKKEAEEILNKELNLKDVEFYIKQTNNKKYSWTESIEIEDRIDSEFYKPKYRYLSKLNNMSELSYYYKISKKRINKNIDRKIKYIDLSSVNNIIEPSDFNTKELPSRAQFLVKEGNLIISTLKGSNKISIIPEHLNDSVCSTGFIVIASKSHLTTEYLYLVFSNKVFNMQIERYSTGSIMSGVNHDNFNKMLIPVISNKQIIDTITNKIRKHFRLLYYSKQLIQEAKQDVEDLIEGNFDMSKVKANN